MNPDSAKRVVVFAYHTVGVRCLDVLHQAGLTIALIVTHRDNPAENQWFDSVADWAMSHHIPFITPDDPNEPTLVAQIAACQPDMLFSFYYRQMLGQALLALPPRGAYNLHGSLLPRYRGRVPINWAVICGETETGATLHAMTLKPDQGDIYAQQRVTIGPNDTAHEVFSRVVDAGVMALTQVLPDLLAGCALPTPQNLALGEYCGGRRPEDGCIDWSQTARTIHNLVRGVAPPYPGAFTRYQGEPLLILETRLEATPQAITQATGGDGRPLWITRLSWRGQALNAESFAQAFPHGWPAEASTSIPSR